MNIEPVVVREDEREWQTLGEGEVLFKTLVSGDITTSENLTLGVAKMPPGGTLDDHHHREAEV